MDDAGREEFDAVVETQIAELPYTVQLLLQETPLVVEDHPSDALLEEIGLSREQADELCGVYCGLGMLERSVEELGLSPQQADELGGGYSGIGMLERSVEDSFTEPEKITIFRRGIILLATSQVDEDHTLEALLEKEIRITILHEIGHHFGLDEDDLEAIGYA